MNQKVSKKEESKSGSIFASLAIPLLVVAGFLLWKFVLGSPSNFADGEVRHTPVKEGIGSTLGLIYLGGFVVPILLSLVLMSITFSIERFLTIGKASGKGSSEAFVRKVKGFLSSGNILKFITLFPFTVGIPYSSFPIDLTVVFLFLNFPV
jgi:biopolymer transport protein ExbB